jgi:hypothetical protein
MLLVLASAGALSAVDLSGIWTGQVTARFDEVQDVTFRFVQTGSGISGKMYGEIESQPVNEGRIEGDQIGFFVGTEMNGGRNRFHYSGIIQGEELHLTRQRVLPPDAPDTEENRKRRVPQKLVLKRLLAVPAAAAR